MEQKGRIKMESNKSEYIYVACGDQVRAVTFYDHDKAWEFVERNEGYDCVVERVGRATVRIGETLLSDKEVYILFDTIDPELKGRIVCDYIKTEFDGVIKSVKESDGANAYDLSLCHSLLESLEFIADCTDYNSLSREDLDNIFDQVSTKYTLSLVIAAVNSMLDLYENTWNYIKGDDTSTIYDTLQKLNTLKQLKVEYVDLYKACSIG